MAGRRVVVGVVMAVMGVDAFMAPSGMQLALRAPHGAACRSGALVPLTMAKGKGGATAAKVQVLLKDTIEGVGKANEVVQVNTGYYNNFLRPKNLATIISDEGVEDKVAKEQEERERIKQVAIEMGTVIEDLGTIVLKKKTGKDNNIFGTVTHKQIVDAIKDKSEGKITFNQKMKWTVPEVAGLGEFTCSVQLHPEVSQDVKVKVEAEK